MGDRFGGTSVLRIGSGTLFCCTVQVVLQEFLVMWDVCNCIDLQGQTQLRVLGRNLSHIGQRPVDEVFSSKEPVFKRQGFVQLGQVLVDHTSELAPSLVRAL